MTDNQFTKRIILGGLPRAGSTLLRFQMDASAEILAGPETGFFLFPLARQQNHLTRIAGKIAQKLDIPVEDVRSSIISSHDSFEAFDGIMTSFASRVGVCKTIWAEKTPTNCYCYHRLAAENSEAYFISIIRNGLDVITSQIDDSKSGVGKYWCSIQRYVDSMRCIYAFRHPKHYILKYEDLITNPQEILSNVFAFLETPFDPGIIEHFNKKSLSRDMSKVHQPKLKRPIQTTWINRWRLPEHADRVADFTARADAMEWMKQSGYSEDIP